MKHTLFSILITFVILSCKNEVPASEPGPNDLQTYQKFTSENSILQNIDADNLTCLEVDDENNIWIGTKAAMGLLSYDPKNDTWRQYENNYLGIDIWAILDIDFDLDGTLWIGTNGGLFTFKDDTFSRVLIDSSGFPSSWVNSVHVDPQNTVWASLNNDLYRFENQNGEHLIAYDTLYNYQIQDLKSDNKGNLWIGTFSGLVKYDGASFTWMDHTAVSTNMNIYDLNLDNEGKLVVGCNGGLFRFQEPNWIGIEAEGFDKPLFNSFEWIVSSIVKNDTSMLYGTWNMGLAIEDSDRFSFMRGSEFQIDTNQFQLNELMYDKQGNLWIGTRNAELIAYNPEGLIF